MRGRRERRAGQVRAESLALLGVEEGQGGMRRLLGGISEGGGDELEFGGDSICPRNRLWSTTQTSLGGRRPRAYQIRDSRLLSLQSTRRASALCKLKGHCVAIFSMLEGELYSIETSVRV